MFMFDGSSFLSWRLPPRSNGALVNMTADAATLAAAEGAVSDFLAALPAASNANGGAAGGWGRELLLPAANEALTVPTQVRGPAGVRTEHVGPLLEL